MLIDPEFAERIINKYAVFGTYRLDEASLVFLKEERQIQPIFAPARKLWFQLYLNWQSYRQSGQQLSVNWNLIEQKITGGLKEEIRQQTGRALREEAERIVLSSLQRESKQYVRRSLQEEYKKISHHNLFEETRHVLEEYTESMSGSSQNNALKREIQRERKKKSEKKVQGSGEIRPSAKVTVSMAEKIGRIIRERIKNEIMHMSVGNFNGETAGTQSNKLKKEAVLKKNSNTDKKIARVRDSTSAKETGRTGYENTFYIGHSKQMVQKAFNPGSVSSFENRVYEDIRQKTGWSIQDDWLYQDFLGQDQNKYRIRMLNSISLMNILNISKLYHERSIVSEPFIKQNLWRKAKNKGLFGYITTIFRNREQQPDEAKKAEKKLIEILVRDFYYQSLLLREQEEKDNQLFIARRAVMELLKETESRRYIQTALLESDTKQQEYIYQVRLGLGDYAAVQMENYFSTRNQITGQALIRQTGLLKQDGIKKIAQEYLSILQKEQTLQSIRPNGYTQMENLVREKVHVPASENLEERRIRLDHIIRVWNKDYSLAVWRNRLAGDIKKMVRYRAAADMITPILMPITKMRLNRWNEDKKDILSFPQENVTGIAGLPDKMIYREIEKSIRQNPDNQEKTNHLDVRMHYDEQTQILKKQSSQEEELRQTKQLVGTLNQRIEMHDTVIKELKKTTLEGEKLPAENVNRIAKEVIKKMEGELRLEKLRRGLC